MKTAREALKGMIMTSSLLQALGLIALRLKIGWTLLKHALQRAYRLLRSTLIHFGVKAVLVEHGGESRCFILPIYLQQMATIKRNGNYTERIIYGYLQQSAILQLTLVYLKKNMPAT